MTALTNKLQSIQVLRGIAAILMVFCHAEQFTVAFMPVKMDEYLGRCFGGFGVDIFFIISGFIMVYMCHKDFGNKATIFPFLQRRFLRIYPLYWIVTLLVLIVMIPTDLYTTTFPPSEHFVISAIYDWRYVLSSFLLIPYYGADGTSLPPIVGIGWTLIYEIFFYVTFSFMLFLPRRRYLWILASLFMGIVVFSHFIPLHVAKTYGHNMILEFILGCYIAERYLAGKFLFAPLAIFSIAFAIFCFIMVYHIPKVNYWELQGFERLTLVYHIKALGVGVPAALLVYGFLSLYERSSHLPRLLIVLGDASYSIYLTHFSISIVIALSLLKFFSPNIFFSGDVIVWLVWMFSIALGYGFYCYVETPLQNMIQFLIKSKPKAVLASVNE